MRRPTIPVFLSAVCFALGGLFFKIIPWEATAIGAARSVLAAGCIFLFLRVRRHRFRINRTVVVSAIAIAVTNTLYAMANKLTTAANAIVLQFSMPAFVILLMFVFYRKRPKRTEIVTCVLVFLGIVCFFLDSLTAGHYLGDALALLAGVCYACYFVFNSREEAEPFTAILLSYGITALIGLPSLLRTDISGAGAGVLLAVLALGVVQQGAGHICLALGIRETSPVAAGLISGIEPVLNPLLVAVFYHEVPSPMSLVGAAIVLAAVIGYNYLEVRAQPRGL